MFIIKKNLAGLTYYWNENFLQWEGLSNNATELTSERLDYWMAEFLKGWDAEDYSFTKIIDPVIKL